MSNKKKILPFVIVAVCIVIIIVCATAAIKTNSNKQSFQSEAEMSEILNGTWRTGDTEFDFIITIQGDSMIMEMGSGEREAEEYHIVLNPEKGYFYTDTNTDNLYKPVIQNGRYVIKTDDWTYEKVE